MARVRFQVCVSLHVLLGSDPSNRALPIEYQLHRPILNHLKDTILAKVAFIRTDIWADG